VGLDISAPLLQPVNLSLFLIVLLATLFFIASAVLILFILVVGQVMHELSDYILDITPAAGSPILASYSAPLSSLAGQAFVAFASGFLDPAQNNNGPSFGLYAALADGTVIPLEDTATARLQIIHNSADPAAAQVDIYVNGSILLDDFAFRSATSYIDVPA
jgi:hypothetical protein